MREAILLYAKEHPTGFSRQDLLTAMKGKLNASTWGGVRNKIGMGRHR